MKIAAIYVYPQDGSGSVHDSAFRFVDSYHRNPAGIDHELVVVCNGSPITDDARFLFGSVENLRFLEHDNSGYDIGAYQRAAREVACDMMVFFGTSTYLKGPGWLKRMADAFTEKGNGLFGTMANTGVPHVGVRPHIRTTAFWLAPALFNQYPHHVTEPGQRYEFEHGATCLTSWVYGRGLGVWVVGWSGIYRQSQWHFIPNGFHSGDQSDMLAGDRHSEPPYHPGP